MEAQIVSVRWPGAVQHACVVAQLGEEHVILGLVQMRCEGNPIRNVERALDYVHDAVRRGADVICLPELFRSQYFCQIEDPDLFDLAEPIPGPTTQAFGKAAKAAGVVVVVPIFERRGPGVYHNSVVVVDQSGAVAGLYRKMHIPDDPGFYEKFYFTPGDRGFQAVRTPKAVLGPLICWDQWFPEAARLTALRGAEILIYPTAIGWHPREKIQEGPAQREAWMTVQRAHAIANGVFVAAVNRVGHEVPTSAGDGIEFWGSSFVCDPFGVVLEQAPIEKEEVIMAELDLGRIENIRRHWPFFRDRRVDAYDRLTQRFLDEEDPR